MSLSGSLYKCNYYYYLLLFTPRSHLPYRHMRTDLNAHPNVSARGLASRHQLHWLRCSPYDYDCVEPRPLLYNQDLDCYNKIITMTCLSPQGASIQNPCFRGLQHYSLGFKLRQVTHIFFAFRGN
jgi:hypothetical protein